jgi:glutamate dehydrogenase (NAD(P)+)
MANGHTTREAEEILSSNGVHIIPDILCNGGGVIVSYLKWYRTSQTYNGKKRKLGNFLRRG